MSKPQVLRVVPPCCRTQFLLATKLDAGKGVPQDDREAAKWYVTRGDTIQK